MYLGKRGLKIKGKQRERKGDREEVREERIIREYGKDRKGSGTMEQCAEPHKESTTLTSIIYHCYT